MTSGNANHNSADSNVNVKETPVILKQLQEFLWMAGQQAFSTWFWHTDSLSDPHFTLDHMIMTHLSLTFNVGVILSSSLPGQRKLLPLFQSCCYCFSIHKDKVSWWPLHDFPNGPISCTTEDFLAIVAPAAITGLQPEHWGWGGDLF